MSKAIDFSGHTVNVANAMSAEPEPDVTAAYWQQVTSASPVVRPERVRRSDLPNSTYGDHVWDLSLMRSKPGANAVRLYFRDVRGRSKVSVPPLEWTDLSKKVAYLHINEPAPVDWTERELSTAVAWLANSTVQRAMLNLYPFLCWLSEQHITCLADASKGALRRYRAHVLSFDVRPRRKHALLAEVERLAALAPRLPAADRLEAPPWKASTVLRPGAQPTGGSARAIHDPTLFGPLLTVAEDMVRVIAPDILSALRAVADWPASEQSGGHTEAELILRSYVEAGGIPAVAKGRTLVLDRSSLAARHGLSADAFSQSLHAHRLKEHLSAAHAVRVPTPVRGLIADRPWCAGVPWSEASWQGGKALLLHLQAACFVVLGYYTQARPDELRALPVDCDVVVPARRDGGPILNVIDGQRFKGVRDERGAADDNGTAARWTTIGPGVDAVRVAREVARRLIEIQDIDGQPNEPIYLFPSEDGRGAVLHATMERRVARMIDWVNVTGEREGWPDTYRIPATKMERLRGLAGFRRTGAPFQRLQYDGAEVLRQQLQHTTEVMGDGYAGTAQVGYSNLLDRQRREEDKRLTEQVAVDLTRGAGVSGPAASRLIATAAEHEPLRAVFLSEREVRDVTEGHLAEGLPVYDNPGAYSLCVFDWRYARCLTPDINADEGPEHVPDRGACQGDCANHARTDRQITDMQAEADRHRREAASPLTSAPMAQRRSAVADLLQRKIQDHESTKVFIGNIGTRAEFPNRFVEPKGASDAEG
jgi:hypothetical protein